MNQKRIKYSNININTKIYIQKYSIYIIIYIYIIVLNIFYYFFLLFLCIGAVAMPPTQLFFVQQRNDGSSPGKKIFTLILSNVNVLFIRF